MVKQLLQTKLSRRSFFKCSLAFGCGCLVPQLAFGNSRNSAEAEKTMADNPLADQAMLLKDFRETNDGALQYMTQTYGADVASSIAQEAERQFEALLPLLPELGGAKNIVIRDFPVALWCVAYLRPMKAHGKTAEELGKMIYDMFDMDLRQMPEEAKIAEGAKLFTPEHIDALKGWARWTQKREYPANWVATFVPGNGADFDYGYDYSECAIVKYLKAHGADEVAPYICLNDFIRSEACDTGLRRTKTLAQGDNVCNFRYKKGRPVTQNWSTEIPN
ncbi:MAG: L-2-amino-thiazoline-4-carboxylic acid hydrolase [Chlamydiota bacterium]|nr:L-2-amino-thiazoline-4-carboxylic acid hydrolase [Chlamydiota bacterium]